MTELCSDIFPGQNRARHDLFDQRGKIKFYHEMSGCTDNETESTMNSQGLEQIESGNATNVNLMYQNYYH